VGVKLTHLYRCTIMGGGSSHVDVEPEDWVYRWQVASTAAWYAQPQLRPPETTYLYPPINSPWHAAADRIFRSTVTTEALWAALPPELRPTPPPVPPDPPVPRHEPHIVQNNQP